MNNEDNVFAALMFTVVIGFIGIIVYAFHVDSQTDDTESSRACYQEMCKTAMTFEQQAECYRVVEKVCK